MKTMKYHRRQKTIVDITQDLAETTIYKSVNQAKKESFKIQMREDGALGRGTLSIS